MTEADKLIEKGSEPGARRLLFAELAAIRFVVTAAADSSSPRRGAQESAKVGVFAWLISTVDSSGILPGTEVDLADRDCVRGDVCNSPLR